MPFICYYVKANEYEQRANDTHPFQTEELESLAFYYSEPRLYPSFWLPSFSTPKDVTTVFQ